MTHQTAQALLAGSRRAALSRSSRFAVHRWVPSLRTLTVALLGLALLCGLGAPRAEAQPETPPKPEDLLGNLVVVAGATRQLPKIAVLPSLASAMEDVTVRAVVRRDLDLCGEFEVLPDSAAPDGLYLSDSPVDVKAWAAKGANAVVRVNGKPLDGGKAELQGLAYFTDSGADPVFDKTFVVPAANVRAESHRVADALIGALTGTSGGFASQMTFVYGTAKLRRVYVIDADGHDPHAVSLDEQVALAPTFGKNHQLYYAASVNYDPYEIFTPGNARPVARNRQGSVYGLAFSPDRDKVAASIAVGETISLFTGPDFQHLEPASSVRLAMQPTFTPSGKLAYVGAGKWSQRVFVEDKAISPDGLSASAPVFCRHPDGVRAVFAVGVGKDLDLVATGERGGSLARLTQHHGRNSYPACSPDGRLVAFFSTRKSNEGPGLYIMRIDGSRPKRVSTLVGDSLVWARLPDPSATTAASKR